MSAAKRTVSASRSVLPRRPILLQKSPRAMRSADLASGSGFEPLIAAVCVGVAAPGRWRWCAPHPTLPARGSQRWRLRGELREPAEVLRDRRKCELVLCATGPAQPQTAEPQDALQVGEQHLDPLAVAARLLECVGACKRASDVAGVLVHVAGDLAGRCLRTALGLQRAGFTHTPEGEVAKRMIGPDGASCRQEVARRAQIALRCFVESEILGSTCRPRVSTCR